MKSVVPFCFGDLRFFCAIDMLGNGQHTNNDAAQVYDIKIADDGGSGEPLVLNPSLQPPMGRLCFSLSHLVRK